VVVLEEEEEEEEFSPLEILVVNFDVGLQPFTSVVGGVRRNHDSCPSWTWRSSERCTAWHQGTWIWYLGCRLELRIRHLHCAAMCGSHLWFFQSSNRIGGCGSGEHTLDTLLDMFQCRVCGWLLCSHYCMDKLLPSLPVLGAS
jgi:hypothetical protein